MDRLEPEVGEVLCVTGFPWILSPDQPSLPRLPFALLVLSHPHRGAQLRVWVTAFGCPVAAAPGTPHRAAAETGH